MTGRGFLAEVARLADEEFVVRALGRVESSPVSAAQHGHRFYGNQHTDGGYVPPDKDPEGKPGGRIKHAVLVINGKRYRGPSHFQALMGWAGKEGAEFSRLPEGTLEGFETESGHFLDRKQAADYALRFNLYKDDERRGDVRLRSEALGLRAVDGALYTQDAVMGSAPKAADVSVKALVFDGRGRVLLLDDLGSGFWDLPGGHVEPGESLAEALVREVKEETGLDVVVRRQVGAEMIDFGGRARPVVFYEAEVVEGGQVKASWPGDPEGHAEAARKRRKKKELERAMGWWLKRTKQAREDAAYEIASNWLDGAEKALTQAEQRGEEIVVIPLSRIDGGELALMGWNAARVHNLTMANSDWEKHVKPMAIERAYLKMWTTPESWPKTIKHFSKGGRGYTGRVESCESFSFVEVLSEQESVKASGQFDESDHPREPAGGPGGGRFTSKTGGVALRREGSGKKSRWVTEEGEELPEHARRLVIPPAWTRVRVAPSAAHDLQAIGYDEKGRAQRIYSDAFTKRMAEAKYERNAELIKRREQVFAQNERNLRSRDVSVRENAAVMKLIQETGIRPGSDADTGAEKQAYGATTLEGRHVVETESGVRLRFVGKKGVSLDIPVENRRVAEMLLERKELAGPKGKLFDTDASKLREYSQTLGGGGFKPKDFRTLKGTTTAIEAVGRNPARSRTLKEYKARVKEIAKLVAAKLGNTPTVALQSYINPFVFDKIRPLEA